LGCKKYLKIFIRGFGDKIGLRFISFDRFLIFLGGEKEGRRR